MRTIVIATIALLLLSSVPVRAQGPDYLASEHTFNSTLSLNQRLFLQNSIIAAGYLKAVPTERFSRRLFDALRSLQAEAGLPPSGRLDVPTLDKALTIANPLYRLWDLKRLRHPHIQRALLMPTGFGLAPIPNDRGIGLRDPEGRLTIRFNYFPNTNAAFNYAEILAKYQRTGVTIHYHVFKGNWFAFSTTSRSGTDGYIRYHEENGGITGFAMFWDNGKGVVNAERIAVLMSAALNSDFGGGVFADPPSSADLNPKPQPRQPEMASRPEPAPAPPSTPPSPAPTTPRQGVSSGTAFFVAQDGTLATNAHVVEGCSAIHVTMRNKDVLRARLLARDATNDLALLKVDRRPNDLASLRGAARLGEDVAAFGFPHNEIFSSSGNFTLGNITATSGLKDDSRYFQVSAQVHSGNSGGPLLDARGNVVGVVTAKLNAIKFATGSGDLPQNVNFAVKSDILMTFLRANGVTTTGAEKEAKLERADLADLARDISAFVTCK